MTQEFNHTAVAREYKLPPMQKIVAQNLLESQQMHAFVTAMAEIPMAAFEKRLKDLKKEIDGVSLTHLIIYDVARSLVNHRKLTSVLSDGMVYEYADINISLALSMPNGDLMTAVIRKADTKSITEIIDEVNDLTTRAMAGKLTMADIRGGTFTISNYGQLKNTKWATPIITPGQSAVLGIGRSRLGLIEDDSAAGYQVTKVLPLSFTYDHRLINGVPAGNYLDDLTNYITGVNK